MTTILVAMPERTYARMMTPELEAELNGLGTIVHCRNGREMTEEAYGALWERADAALTGWGVRAPTPAMLDRATRLRIISHTAGSVRMLPRYALEKGIVITTARAGIARTVAEFCLMNALLLLRRGLYDLTSEPERRRALAPEGSRPPTETLHGKTVGLIGFGEIGTRFREMLAPFGCRVLVYDPYLSQESAAHHRVERADLPTLLQTSRIVSLHAPDIPATQGMIGAKELALLRDGTILLNSARGRLIDTGALTAALQAGRLVAAIDVTDPEPLPADHPLRTLPNVLFTPHVAGPTDDDVPEMTRMALTDLGRFLRGEAPLYPMSLAGYDVMSF
jgi:phosphoglycerate dehydrogenase-like enzyme